MKKNNQLYTFFRFSHLPKGTTFLWFILFLLSCHQSSRTPEAFVHWVRDESNGLISEISRNDLVFQLAYQPPALMALKELGEEGLTTEIFQEKVKEYAPLEYYLLNISSSNKTTNVVKYNLNPGTSIEDRMNYMSFDMQNDFKLVSSGEPFVCKLFHFEHPTGVSPFISFLIAFDPVDHQDRTIQYIDRVFGLGTIEFRIKDKAIANIPKFEI